MSEGKHAEIERKYLIAMPNEALLRSRQGCAVWEIEQTYLMAQQGETRRVRRVSENGENRYYRTFKRPVSALTSEEDEAEIDERAYRAYLKEIDPSLRPILKTRYRIPWNAKLLEVDLYPFWRDRAILEIELQSETEGVSLPEWLRLIREVTEDHRYKNVSLAREIVMEEI
ncbi:MAG: hypothetical protein IJ234_03520 [Clostridia bacterium]|nr:hypothetical protein [Clostridia bacterium]